MADNGDAAIEGVLKALVALHGNPVVSFLSSQVANQIKHDRLAAGAETLRRRMASGKPWRFRESEVASLTFDFLRAAEDGAAKVNLGVMADLIANGISEDGFTEEAVRHLMKTVAGLSYEEMRVLAAFIRAVRGLQPPEGGEPIDAFRQTSEVWGATWRQLAKAGDSGPTNEVFARAGALQRTGLVVAHSAFGGMVYGPTPLLMELERLSALSEID